jgi:hypothetical protein
MEMLNYGSNLSITDAKGVEGGVVALGLQLRMSDYH